MVSHYPVELGGLRHCGSGDMFLVDIFFRISPVNLNITLLFISKAHDMKAHDMSCSELFTTVNNPGHNILKLYNILVQARLTKSKTKSDIWCNKLGIQVV